MRRPPLFGTIAAVLGFVVVMVAASSGAVDIWDAPPPSRSSGRAPVQQEVEVEATPVAAPEASDVSNRVLEAIVTAIGILLLAAIAFAVGQAILNRWRSRRRRPPDRSRRTVAALPEVDDDLPVVTLDVDAQLAALAQGSPRNAIVACWLRMEEDVAEVGLPRHPAETSAEFTTRVLASCSLDAAPVIELASLYREARFSAHPLGQEHRERAVTAVRLIHAGLASTRAEASTVPVP